MDRPNGSEPSESAVGAGETKPAGGPTPTDQVVAESPPAEPKSTAPPSFWRQTGWPLAKQHGGRVTMLILAPIIAIAWILASNADDERRLRIFALLLLVGFVLAWYAEFVFKVNLEKFMVLIVVLPLLYYVIDTGKFRLESVEIGGLAKLDIAAEDEVKLLSEEAPIDVGNVTLDDNAVTMVLGDGSYTATGVLATLGLPKNQSVKFIVFVRNNQISAEDQRRRDNQFAGFLPVQVVREQLNDPDTRDVFIQLVNSGTLGGSNTGYPLIVASIPPEMSNLDALRRMMDENLEAVALVDEDGEPAGVVERGQILSRLVLAVADAETTVTPTAAPAATGS
jgi:hypothetical protein